MIRAIVFDLDGTLVQTERLKAISYARAAVELRPGAVREAEVVEAFKGVVGRSRHEVAAALVERLGLEEAARARMAELGVSTPWQAFVQIRLRIYEAMIASPQTLRDHQWPHNVAYLQKARELGLRTALATMSTCEQATRVLQALDLVQAFEFVATRDDVERGKPDPEIYELVVHHLGIAPAEALVIEDSPVGVQSARTAGAYVVAVATPFTQKGLHELNLLPLQHIVDDPAQLLTVIDHVIRHSRPDEPEPA